MHKLYLIKQALNKNWARPLGMLGILGSGFGAVTGGAQQMLTSETADSRKRLKEVLRAALYGGGLGALGGIAGSALGATGGGILGQRRFRSRLTPKQIASLHKKGPSVLSLADNLVTFGGTLLGGAAGLGTGGAAGGLVGGRLSRRPSRSNETEE
jgi:hypothetical protein